MLWWKKTGTEYLKYIIIIITIFIYLFISIKMVVGRPEAWRYTVLDEL